MSAVIRPARPDEASALAELKHGTFRESFVDGGFAIPYPPDDLVVFETATFGIEKIRAELSDPGRMTWVAELDGRMVGYAHVGPTKLPHPDCLPEHGELYQIYVLQEAQGLGLGTRMMDLSLAYLADQRPGPIWLGVWSGNLRAQAIYATRRFVKHGEYEFPVGTWRDREFILRREG
jgi:ribosomal protein S18 acetylase RimI-like enzyme